MTSAAPDTFDDPIVRAVLSERFGFLFAKLHHRWSVASTAALHEAGLGLTGMHIGALSVIDSTGPISQQELGEHIKKDRTSIVSIVDELEGEGLLERRRNPADRRAYALEVTAKGNDWLARARPALAAVDEKLMAELEPDERGVLIDLLQRVLFSSPQAD